MTLVPYGDAAWRIELPARVDRRAVQQLLRRWPGVVDALVTDRHALVCFAPDHPPPDPRDAMLHATSEKSSAPRVHLVRVRYDGPDLAAVAASLGRTVDEVIALHARAYEVQLVGFLPGFAYLGPVAPELASVPRRSSPRPRVPALSVGLAAGRTGIYPMSSPGGWQLLGTALDVAPFDPERGALFALGDRVVIEPA